MSERDEEDAAGGGGFVGLGGNVGGGGGGGPGISSVVVCFRVIVAVDLSLFPAMAWDPVGLGASRVHPERVASGLKEMGKQLPRGDGSGLPARKRVSGIASAANAGLDSRSSLRERRARGAAEVGRTCRSAGATSHKTTRPHSLSLF